MGIFKLRNSLVAHKDICVGCQQEFDNEELHSVVDRATDKTFPMCTPCIEIEAAKQESQDHDMEAYRLPTRAYEFDPSQLG